MWDYGLHDSLWLAFSVCCGLLHLIKDATDSLLTVNLHSFLCNLKSYTLYGTLLHKNPCPNHIFIEIGDSCFTTCFFFFQLRNTTELCRAVIHPYIFQTFILLRVKIGCEICVKQHKVQDWGTPCMGCHSITGHQSTHIIIHCGQFRDAN